MKRRNFIKKSALGAVGLSAVSIPGAYSMLKDKNPMIKEMFVGTPVLPEFLYENGIARTLDQMQEWADINTVMTFSHDHVFNQYRQNYQPKVDKHGNEYTNVWVHSHAKYYEDPKFIQNDEKGKYADKDILDELHKETSKRGMDVYARILEPYVITGAIPGFEEFAEIDADGNKRNNVCYNHPGYIGYWHSVIEDLVRSHPYLNGFKFGQERGGPILSSLGKKQPGTCFCKHCLSLAQQKGIDTFEARKGLKAIQEYGIKINNGNKPIDGNFTSFIRVLMQYPEVLAWEKFWMDSRENQRKRIYKQIKDINPDIQVGWHIDHGMTWDIITRASWDYSEMGPYSDWLSVAVYFDSMGRRSMGHYNNNYKDILFGDADEKYSYPMYLSMLGYDPEQEPPLSAHREKDTSFTHDYVYRECKRAVEAVGGKAQVQARPGFDMPGYDCNVTPKEVEMAVQGALNAGVDGMWCGREWDELKPENARAFGKTVRDYLKG